MMRLFLLLFLAAFVRACSMENLLAFAGDSLVVEGPQTLLNDIVIKDIAIVSPGAPASSIAISISDPTDLSLQWWLDSAVSPPVLRFYDPKATNTPIENGPAFLGDPNKLQSPASCLRNPVAVTLASLQLLWPFVSANTDHRVVIGVPASVLDNVATRAATGPHGVSLALASDAATSQMQSAPLGVECGSFGLVVTLEVAANARDVVLAIGNDQQIAAATVGNPHGSFAGALRFGATAPGVVDVRDGSAYSAATPLASGTTRHQVVINVDMLKRRYSANVDGKQLASAAFRTDVLAAEAAINTVAIWAKEQEQGVAKPVAKLVDARLQVPSDVDADSTPSNPVQPNPNPNPNPNPIPDPIPTNKVFAPLPQANLMKRFWRADFDATPDLVLTATDAASLRTQLVAAAQTPNKAQKIEIQFKGAAVASDVKVYGAWDADFRKNGGQLVLRAMQNVQVTGLIALEGILGIGFVGPWTFARVGVSSAGIDTVAANVDISPPKNRPKALGGLTLEGIKGGVPNAAVLAGAKPNQYMRQFRLRVESDVLMRNCEFRHYLEVLDATAGGRIVVVDNFFVGGVDDILFVHNSQSAKARTIYTYAVNNVVGPGLNSPDTTALHPDFLQHVSDGGKADDQYVDDVHFTVAINVNNDVGYPWQFLWPGEGESPQPRYRKVTAFNNVYTCGFRAINVQSAHEEWAFNVVSLSPGPRNNPNLQPLVFANTNFIGQGGGAKVHHNVLGRERVDYRAADRTLQSRDVIVADPLARSSEPTSYASVFGVRGVDAANGGFIEQAPASLSATTATAAGVRAWAAANRAPLPAGGWAATGQAGQAFINPLHFATPDLEKFFIANQ